MAVLFSFDIASEYNLAEVINAIDQTKREIVSRYDFKGTNASVEFSDADKTGLTIVGDSQYHIDSILDIIRKKFAARGVSQKVLDTSGQPTVSNLKTTLRVPFRKGLDQDKAKKVTALIREQYPKAKAQIQGAEIRVSSPKKDELQGIIQLLESSDFDFPLEFTNFR